MKKIFLFICTVALLNSLVKAQNSSYDSNAVSIGGTNNVGFGLGALKVSNGQHNVAIGIGALENLGAASSNTAVGFGAMQNSVSGFFNTAIGLGALRNNQYDYNTALGWGALNSNTGGEFNTGTGGEALANNTTGISNTANGFRALFSNTTGESNTATGLQSLYFNINGSFNTANGYKALYNNTTGSYNTANGYEALVANTIGEFNTSNGFRSFFNNTTGTSGTAMGHGALYANTTGNNNTATGLIALFNNTTGNNNTAHGKDALVHNITGDNNSALGFGADVATGSLNNTTAIGALAIVNESNAIQLGNNGVTKIFAGVGNNATIITGGLQVTGGTPAVGKVLTSDAAGVASWQTPVMGIGGGGTLNYVSKFTPDGITLGNSQIFDNGTNIGIGTTSPLAKLDITGNIKIADGTQGAGRVLTSDANGLATWQTPASGGGAGWLLTGNAGTVDGTNFIGTTDNVPFNIRVNNQKSGRIETGLFQANTLFGYQSGNNLLPGNFRNTAFGYQSLFSAQSGQNTAVGFQTLFSNTIGINNVALGVESLKANTTGNYNTATGPFTLLVNTTGGFNTAMGDNALRMNNANFNTAVGFSSLRINDSGSRNTVIGGQSMHNNVGGSNNFAAGFQALGSNGTGSNNTAAGFQALITNTSGNNNTALGNGANVSTGALTNATAIGNQAIVSQSDAIQLGNNAVTRVFAGTGNNATIVTGGLQVTGGSPAAGKVLTSTGTTGVAIWQTPAAAVPSWSLTGNAGTVDVTNFIGTTDNVPLNIRVNNQKAGRIESNANTANTFLGYKSGNANTGGYNTAVGYTALALNAGAVANTATGSFALSANTTGNYNSAFGSFALNSNTNGNFNTAIGNAAMLSNDNGRLNTAIGVEALTNNVNGGRNIAVGGASMVNNISGGFNTALGTFSLATNISGDFNTAVGYNAAVSSGALTNATSIGYNSTVNTSDKVRIGNTAVSVIEGQVAWSNPSDGRFKNNISEKDVKGLDFITKLRPVVYNFDTRKFQKFLTKNMSDSVSKRFMEQDFGPSTSIRQSGFIAQEVEKAAKESGYDFNGIHKPENENDNYSLAYSQFVVPLVKAMQEQQEMIAELQKQVKQLQHNQQNNLTETSPAVSSIELADNSAIVLNQNVPNPFAQQTSISYTIPASANAAQILFYSLEGRLMKTANITTRGKGILNVFASDLSSGSYTYSLMIDGKIVDTKKLVKQ